MLNLFAVLWVAGASISILPTQHPLAAKSSPDDQILLLDGDNWSLRNANGSISIDGSVVVPSTVPDQLYKHGILSRDPRYGYEQDVVFDLMASDNFTYSVQVRGYSTRVCAVKHSLCSNC